MEDLYQRHDDDDDGFDDGFYDEFDEDFGDAPMWDEDAEPVRRHSRRRRAQKRGRRRRDRWDDDVDGYRDDDRIVGDGAKGLEETATREVDPDEREESPRRRVVLLLPERKPKQKGTFMRIVQQRVERTRPNLAALTRAGSAPKRPPKALSDAHAGPPPEPSVSTRTMHAPIIPRDRDAFDWSQPAAADHMLDFRAFRRAHPEGGPEGSPSTPGAGAGAVSVEEARRMLIAEAGSLAGAYDHGRRVALRRFFGECASADLDALFSELGAFCCIKDVGDSAPTWEGEAEAEVEAEGGREGQEERVGAVGLAAFVPRIEVVQGALQACSDVQRSALLSRLAREGTLQSMVRTYHALSHMQAVAALGAVVADEPADPNNVPEVTTDAHDMNDIMFVLQPVCRVRCMDDVIGAVEAVGPPFLVCNTSRVLLRALFAGAGPGQRRALLRAIAGGMPVYALMHEHGSEFIAAIFEGIVDSEAAYADLHRLLLQRCLEAVEAAADGPRARLLDVLSFGEEFARATVGWREREGRGRGRGNGEEQGWEGEGQGWEGDAREAREAREAYGCGWLAHLMGAMTQDEVEAFVSTKMRTGFRDMLMSTRGAALALGLLERFDAWENDAFVAFFIESLASPSPGSLSLDDIACESGSVMRAVEGLVSSVAAMRHWRREKDAAKLHGRHAAALMRVVSADLDGPAPALLLESHDGEYRGHAFLLRCLASLDPTHTPCIHDGIKRHYPSAYAPMKASGFVEDYARAIRARTEERPSHDKRDGKGEGRGEREGAWNGVDAEWARFLDGPPQAPAPPPSPPSPPPLHTHTVGG